MCQQLGTPFSRSVSVFLTVNSLLSALALLLWIGVDRAAAGTIQVSDVTKPGLSEPFSASLVRINWYRTAVGLPPYEIDAELSDAAARHSMYLVKNQIPGGDVALTGGMLQLLPAAFSPHEESEGNRWYSREGSKAAWNGYILRGRWTSSDGAPVIDQLMTMPFSSMFPLQPQISALGFGSYCDQDDCALTVAIKLGLSKDHSKSLYLGSFGRLWNPANGKIPFTRARLSHPIEYPAPGSHLPLIQYAGGDIPDPLPSCPGYEVPTGPAVVLQIGAPGSGEGEVEVSSYSIAENGVELESCAIDAAKYENPDGFQQRRGREALHMLGAVTLVPRKPFKPGHQYSATIVADAKEYSWSFDVAVDAK
jgi:hypothetical protein